MVAVSWIEGGSKINSEGMSSSAGGHFGGGTLGEKSSMVSNLVLNSTEIKPPYYLPVVHKISLSQAVAKQFRTSYLYDDYTVGRRLRFRPLKMEYLGALQGLTS